VRVPVGEKGAEGDLSAAVGGEVAEGLADSTGASAVLRGEHVEESFVFVVESDRGGTHGQIVARACYAVNGILGGSAKQQVRADAASSQAVQGSRVLRVEVAPRSSCQTLEGALPE